MRDLNLKELFKSISAIVLAHLFDKKNPAHLLHAFGKVVLQITRFRSYILAPSRYSSLFTQQVPRRCCHSQTVYNIAGYGCDAVVLGVVLETASSCLSIVRS